MDLLRDPGTSLFFSEVPSPLPGGRSQASPAVVLLPLLFVYLLVCTVDVVEARHGGFMCEREVRGNGVLCVCGTWYISLCTEVRYNIAPTRAWDTCILRRFDYTWGLRKFTPTICLTTISLPYHTWCIFSSSPDLGLLRCLLLALFFAAHQLQV